MKTTLKECSRTRTGCKNSSTTLWPPTTSEYKRRKKNGVGKRTNRTKTDSSQLYALRNQNYRRRRRRSRKGRRWKKKRRRREYIRTFIGFSKGRSRRSRLRSHYRNL